MSFSSVSKHFWDAIVVGGGHNGLVAAAYLAKAGKKVCVLERRHIVGGAAVTEEIFPNYHFSRASYVFSLFRPQIIEDLDLRQHGLRVFPRDPSSFTPTLEGKSLLLHGDIKTTQESIAQFSQADAEAFPRYTETLEKMVDFFTPLLDQPPPDLRTILNTSSSYRDRMEALRSVGSFGFRVSKLGPDITTFLDFMTAPASKILDKWFESDILKATLATDAIIGAKVSPSTPGSGYILFHHVMGEVDGIKGTWGHVEGGMGAVSNALASAARSFDVKICTEAKVGSILVDEDTAVGVTLESGETIYSQVVLSGASTSTTLLDLVGKDKLPQDVVDHFSRGWDEESTSTKINVALDRLPNFTCLPNDPSGKPMPHHRGTTHFEDTMGQIEVAFGDAQQGHPSHRPVIEMNIPTSLDSSIAPPGKHIALLFVQYTPYAPKNGSWSDDNYRAAFADTVFSVIEEYAPGFKESIIGIDMLTPPDLERIFSLPKGNIFHGALGLDQLFWMRPMPGYSSYRSPISNLYLASASTHPGGGVMGACGRNAAVACLSDMNS